MAATPPKTRAPKDDPSATAAPVARAGEVVVADVEKEVAVGPTATV
jgi:hypothetical protein